MEAGWLARARWRRRGAWLWPTFAAATFADAAIGSELPLSGETQSLYAAAIAGCVLSLIGVVVLSAPVAAAHRRLRPDLPRVVARDRAGTMVVVAVTLSLLAAGIVHRPSILAHRRAMQDAIARAQAWIGDRAPAGFRANLSHTSTFAIEPGSIYRTCVLSSDRRHTFCVVVNTQLPFASSVSFDGYEANSVLDAGAG
ncbi:MAG: hypothetical protein DLM64_11500 [Solirubrobacterales bacterium]|nr:MAG: hypothetical protein DLM64_11500 [Solirubrobacterales bacterium]